MRKFENATPFMSIPDAARCTGLSQYYLRSGCKDGSVPHVMSGSKYLINVPKLLQDLDVRFDTKDEK